MLTILWWGRSDQSYSRNQIILKLLAKLGCRINFFHPVASRLGGLEAFFRRFEIPQLIWVPCFRQRDMRSAAYWARKWNCPLVFDPLISAYQKEVFEKTKWPTTHKSAIKLHSWEANLFQTADVVIADTDLHAQFYVDNFGLETAKILVVHVGADEQIFKPTEVEITRTPLEVLFYGSFLALQGPEVIIEAARMVEDKTVQWVLLGDGDLRPGIEKRAAGLANVRFEPWIRYEHLPGRLGQAQILLGIFGGTPKAGMVIPNKVFQSMAVGRPLITRVSDAYPEEIRKSRVIGWVPPENPQALADMVQKMAARPDRLIDLGRQTRRLYEKYFSLDHIQQELQLVLGKVLRHPRELEV